MKSRLKQKDGQKSRITSGCYLRGETELKLARHILALQAAGFVPTATIVRKIAYDLAVKMNLKVSFNRKQIIGGDWFFGFMKRNGNVLNNGKALATGDEIMNREEVKIYFNLLEKILINHELKRNPASIFNMGETTLRVNTKPSKTRGAKDSNVTASADSENITVVACSNAEGEFLPPLCIFKDSINKVMPTDGMPPETKIVTNKMSDRINSEIFTTWLNEHFIPRKQPGKCLLILDGHTSHVSSFALLETTAKNDFILLGLPSHTTNFLQPLDRCFFNSLKTCFRKTCDECLLNHPDKKNNEIPNWDLTGKSLINICCT